MNRTQLIKMAEDNGWKLDIRGSFHDGYEAELESPDNTVIFGTDSDFQYICIPEACPISDIIEEIRYIIEDIGYDVAD